MSFPRYQQYVDSGTGWLGEYPSHWKAVPLWTLFWRIKRQGHSEEELLSVYRDHGVVPKSSRDDNNNKQSDDLSVYQLVDVGDLVINKMKAWQGSVAISQVRGIVSPAYFTYQATHQEDQRFLHYLMRSQRYITGYLSLSKGIRVNQWDLEPQYHSRMPVLLPPIEEQRRIADLLDRETAKIDALVEEQERLIELLKEKRQAAITQAVTKGLNQSVPMKDSGVEWLGKVPAHWKFGKAGFYVSVLPGYAFSSGDFSLHDSDTKLLRGINVGVGELRWDDVVYWVRKPSDGLDAYELAEGDVVIGMDRPLIADGMRVARVTLSDLPCLLLQRVAKVQPGSLMDSRFIMRLLSSLAFEAHFAPETTGVSVPHISGEQICCFLVPVPPLEEQRQICDFVEVEIAKIDALTREAEFATALLVERRSALISAAVTGKIDVRGLVEARAIEGRPRPKQEEASNA
jgi:type I restriction enzyme S subunit